MSLTSLLSLALAMLILATSPGPGVFATVARSLASGFQPALRIIAGIVTGDIIYLMFAVFGLSFFAQAFGELFVIVRICGGAYLIWLGLKIFFSEPSDGNLEQAHRNHPESRNFISGLLITLSNPKVILFYCGFLPTFTDLSVLNSNDIFTITLVVTVVLTSVLTAYAYAASQARYFLSNHKSVKIMNRSAGGIMIATGTVIAAGS
jgi:threonine/homoserine/homoserine lactone efflux protein